VCHFMYDFLRRLRRQVANGCFYSIKNIFFWVCNSNIVALWRGVGSVQGAGGHDHDYSMVVEFWELNVFLFLSVLNLFRSA